MGTHAENQSDAKFSWCTDSWVCVRESGAKGVWLTAGSAVVRRLLAWGRSPGRGHQVRGQRGRVRCCRGPGTPERVV